MPCRVFSNERLAVRILRQVVNRLSTACFTRNSTQISLCSQQFSFRKECVVRNIKFTDKCDIYLTSRSSLCIPYIICWAGVEAGTLLMRSSNGLLYQPWMIDDDRGALGGITIGRTLSSGKLSRRCQLKMSSCTWYRVASVRRHLWLVE
jgi:hypothetical protein